MSAEERLLEAAIAYLGRRLGPRAMLNDIVIGATGSDGIKQKVKLDGLAARHSTEENEGGGSTIRQAILEVLADADRPLKGGAIARRAGRSYSGPFRAALREMSQPGGPIRQVEAGFELADSQASQAEQ